VKHGAKRVTCDSCFVGLNVPLHEYLRYFEELKNTWNLQYSTKCLQKEKPTVRLPSGGNKDTGGNSDGRGTDNNQQST
jgi:hypothetical protein